MKSPTNYTQGYSQSTLASHSSRTVHSDAAFLLPHLKPTDAILDVGCGPGAITVGFAAFVSEGSVVGVDLSEKVLENAKTHLSQAAELDLVFRAQANRVTFQQADLLKGLPFADNTFDIVFSSQIFPHLPPIAGEDGTPLPLRAAQEMHRVLKPGGLLATRDVADIHWYPQSIGLDELWNKAMLKTLGMAMFPGGNMPALVKSAGFESRNIKLTVGTTMYSCQDLEAKRAHGTGMLGRLSEGDPYREGWLRAGVTRQEIAATQKALQEWIDCDETWYVVLQAEVLAWKWGKVQSSGLPALN